MKVTQFLTAVFAAAMSLFNVGTAAALTPGDKAPDFKAPSALDGKVVEFNLKDALSKHAIVLYFFPKAFTAG
jgi:thioredoxin-dependent peroxiredoxin